MINVCFACNDNYYELLMVAISSIQKVNKDVVFYIYYNSEKKRHFASTTELIQSNGNKIVFINQELVNSLLPKNLKQHAHITKEAYVRLLLPSLINEDIVIYLDPDVIVRDNLSSLHSSIKGNGLSAIAYDKSLNWIIDRNKSIGLSDNHNYFNSGVLGLDLNILRSNKMLNQTLSLIESNSNLDDQDALNIVFADKYTKLENKYNWTLHDLRSNIDPCIVHFTGPFKPNIKFYVHPYSGEFGQLFRELFPNKTRTLNFEYLRGPFIKAIIKQSYISLISYFKTLNKD
jgi:lipopolysaccharide biosynthesis glycosyltransferase